jgi:hypothetical protein
MEEIHAFLGVSQHNVTDLAARNAGDSRVADADSTEALAQYYSLHNSELFELLGRTYDWS